MGEPSLKCFNDVMRYGVSQNWTPEQVVKECQRRFGQIRSGVRAMKKSYTEMKKGADATPQH
jgi:hypothetical protein